MNKFPDSAKAEYLLREVDPDDILIAARMHYPSGIHDEWISTLEELMWFLQPASDRDIPGVSIEGLAEWVSNAVGDTALAQRLLECQKEHGNFVDACEAAYYEVKARVEKLKESAREKRA